MKEQLISPFKIHIPDERLAAIMAKVKAYDWTQLPDTGGWRPGVGIEDLKRLVDYWQTRFDWRTVERRLNELPQFTTDLEGERIHFIHRKPHPWYVIVFSNMQLRCKHRTTLIPLLNIYQCPARPYKGRFGIDKHVEVQNLRR
ncbi:epoxide hydrolase N-terminal domain-containing protein [Larkinella arboricola]